MKDFNIRPSQPRDQAGAYHVCLKTGDYGQDGEAYYRDDPDALGRLFVGPYLAFEPDLSLILEDQEGICGYALGAFDSRAFYARYDAEWRPKLCAQFSLPSGDDSRWTRSQQVHQWYHQPDYFCPEPYEDYPSHLHIDLLTRAQGLGFGRRMLETVMENLRRRGSPGAHLGVSTRNSRALGFYERLGFRELIRVGSEKRVASTSAKASDHEPKQIKVMPQKLALWGGKPIRAKPFPSWPVFSKAEETRLLRTLRGGKWGRMQGDQVAEFENRFAAAHGCKHGIAVVNGTVSLRIALMAAGIRAEDEVIVPPYTFVSTATAVIEANAIPVFADINLDTFNLDPNAVEAALTPRTKAIIPVHFAGQMADMDSIMAIAKKHKLIVIEDAAHAHGASVGNRPAGSIGHLGSFSFQSSKNMTAGEGGIITTNDEGLAESCRSIHSCGRVPGGLWYEHHVISGNYRLGEFQGAILNCQLDRLENQTRKRDRNGRYLAARLSALPGLHPQRSPQNCTRHSYHLFMMRIDSREFGIARPAVIKALQAEGIPCSGGYGYSLPRQPLFQNKAFGPYLPRVSAKLDYRKTKCPNSDLLCREQCLWLEQSMFLGSTKDMDDIARAFEKIFANRDALNAAFLKTK